MSLARWRAAVDTSWHQNKGELGDGLAVCLADCRVHSRQMKWHIAHSICLLLCSRTRRCCSLGQAAPPLTSFTAGRPARSSAKLWQSTSAGWMQRARGRKMDATRRHCWKKRRRIVVEWFRVLAHGSIDRVTMLQLQEYLRSTEAKQSAQGFGLQQISSSGCALAPQICTLHFCVYPATVYPQTTSCTHDHVTSAWVAQHLHGSE